MAKSKKEVLPVYTPPHHVFIKIITKAHWLRVWPVPYKFKNEIKKFV